MMKKTILILSILSFLISDNLTADNWVPIHDNPGMPAINAGSLFDGFSTLIAVGDSGMVYKVKNDGFWEAIQPITNTRDLLDVDITYDPQANLTKIIAVGTHGKIISSIDTTRTWRQSNYGSEIVFNALGVTYESESAQYFTGGEKGALFYSDDLGDNWTDVSLSDTAFNIVGFVGDHSGLFLYGTKHDSSFILLKTPFQPVFNPIPGDTIANEKLSSAFFHSGGMGSSIYFCGTDLISNESNIYKKINPGMGFEPVVKIYTGIPANATDIGGYENIDNIMTLWVTTDDGEIWKSSGNDNIWNQIYKNDDNRSINAIVVNPMGGDYGDYAYALGDGEMFLKYGFDLNWINPDQNDQFGYGLDRIEMFFSSIPDIQSIQNGILLRSSVSGKLNINASYNETDSTIVYITFSRPNSGDGGIIPGEHLSFNITGPIKSNDAMSSKIFKMTREYDILSIKPSDVKFKSKYVSPSIGSKTTNYVTGFFNDDDTFDIITYANDSLYCYAGNDTNGFDAPVTIAVLDPTYIDTTFSIQLLKYDIDNDGKIDLVLYDSNRIRLYRNQSSGNSFVFSEEASYTAVVIRTIEIEDLNKNGLPDFLVMGNSFYLLPDVTFSGFPSPVMDDLNYSFYDIMKVGDIDRDGWNETALCRKNNELLIMRGGNEDNLFVDTWIAPQNNYIDIQLADLNRDGLLEVIALNDNNEFNIYKQDFGQSWAFTISNILPYSGSDTLKSFIIQDFGGMENQNHQRLMDIAATTNSNQLVIFENASSNETAIVFAQDTSAVIKTSIAPTGLAQGDFDKDGSIDPFSFNQRKGRFETAALSTIDWQPIIHSADVVGENEITLTWSSLPTELGTLQFYQIQRDISPEFDPESPYYKQDFTMDTTYTDFEAWGANDYWYSITAAYNTDDRTRPSAPMQVVKSYKLNGDITGVLDLTDKPYLVSDSLRIPAGGSLLINQGVTIAFMPDTRFDVEGSLDVQGNPFDDGEKENMVNFRGIEDTQKWSGVIIYPGTDTVRINWLSIENAQTGITVDNRPVKYIFGGLIKNDTAIVVRNDSLDLQNVVFDSNKVAISLENGTRAFIKNIDIMWSENAGIIAEPGSKSIIKNSIFWDNNFSSIVSNTAAQDLQVTYSTVDTILGTYSGHDNLNIPPLLMPPDSGFFRIDYSSPTIDAGDPADDFSMEPMPNGGRINQGTFGGTPYATHSMRPSNLRFDPPFIHLEAHPTLPDTAFIKITNESENNIHINAAYLKNGQFEFALFNIGQSDIPSRGTLNFYLTFLPDSKGLYLDTLVIDSNDPLAPVQHLAIEGLGLNTPPFVTSGQEMLFAVTNQEFRHKVPVYDIDGDTLSFTLQNGPPWLSVNDQGILNGMPAAQDTGIYHIDVFIRDGYPDSYVNYFTEIFVVNSSNLLEGPISGIIDISSMPYFVRSNINVPKGSSLEIRSGVRLLFAPQTQFDVYGALKSIGTVDKMIEFLPTHFDSTWSGIKIHSGSDTVVFKNFVISRADTAIFSLSRILNIDFCGIVQNNIGIAVKNDSAIFKHVYIDSNNIGMIIDQSTVDIQNISIFNSFTRGLEIKPGSMVKLRNGILWNNQNNSVVSKVTSDHLYLYYSTIDNIQGNYTGFKISTLTPVINPPYDGPSLIDPSSPTIDAGDPLDDFRLEPVPNGSRINQGAFGGTMLATSSFQGGLQITPDPIQLSAFPGEVDTLFISVKNSGGSELNISGVNLSHPMPEFSVLANPPYTVLSQDSIVIPILFKPQSRESYLDTLIFSSNDPHYIDGFRYVPIIGTGLNHAPRIIGTAPNQTRVANEYSYKIRVFDAENDPISFTPVQMPAWLSLADSGVINGTPALADTGINHIEISLNDTHGGYATFSHNLLVWVTDNDAPNITITYRPKLIVRQSAVHFEFFADDTSGFIVGDNPDQLFTHYRLISLTDHNILIDVDSTKENKVTLYPLNDGNYEFQIWAYDTHGNGIKGVLNKKKVSFNISSSKTSLRRFRWYMVSFPRAQTFNLKKLNEDSTAIVLRWNSKENGYLPPEKFEINMGDAFWIQSLKTYNVDLTSFKQANKNDSLYTHIQKGWNQVGIPMGYAVNWKDMYFISDSTGEKMFLSDVLESNAVYWYIDNIKFQGYEWAKPDTALASPWKGYWLKSNYKGVIVFPKTPSIKRLVNNTDSTYLAEKTALAKLTTSNWQLNLTLSNDKYIDNGNIIGIAPDGKKDVIYEPPHFGDFCSLFFSDAKGNLTQNLKNDFIQYDDVINWDFTVKSTASKKEHHLKWKNSELDNLSLYIYLIDLENETIISMNSEESYTFIPNSTSKTFKIYATQDASFQPQIVPLKFKLLQNYPNPFNPITTIRFGIPESLNNQKIIITVFDILGREIVTLLNKKLKMGYHEIKWNGKNATNIPTASGIYFYQVKGGSELLVKKMILIR